MPYLTLAQLREHVETDLVDAALTRVLTGAIAEVEHHYGPLATAAETYYFGGHLVTAALFVRRPAASITSIAETTTGIVSGEVTTNLAANDYALRSGGRVIERLATGTNPRASWGDRVLVTYVPVDESDRRNDVIIDLTKLELQYAGVDSERIGDYAMSALDYAAERNRLLRRLQRIGAA